MDHFGIEAIKHEKAFLKKWRDKPLQTVTGKENVIVEVSKTAIFVVTEKSKTPNKVSRERLRSAIRQLLFKRHISRADLGHFSNFNSSLMAVLIAMFAQIAKVKQTLRFGYRLVLNGLRWFPAGAERGVRDLEIAVKNGIRFVLFSFWNLRQDRLDRWKFHIKRLGLKVLLDSGEFSRYRAHLQGKNPEPIDIEEYAAFVRKHADVLFGYMNLDVVGDAKKSKENFETLRTIVGFAPIPVFHVQSDWVELEELIADESPVIAIGGSVFLSESKRREVFTELFRRYPDGAAYHCLGLSSALLHEFPWFSADSSGWLAGRKYRKLLTPSGQIKAPETWTDEECLAYNVQYLVSLENPYGVQFAGVVQPIAN